MEPKSPLLFPNHIRNIQPSLTPNSSSNQTNHVTNQSSIGNTSGKTCYLCSKPSTATTSSVATNGISMRQDHVMIGCSSCHRYSHPSCLALNPALANWGCIRAYDWQCMECKICTTCKNPNDEDKMMFCDRCDRGFHTYCVGVNDVPTGSWMCLLCSQVISNEQTNNTRTPTSSVRLSLDANSNDSSIITTAHTPKTPTFNSQTKNPLATGRRGRPPGSLNKPKDQNSPKKTP
jgi:hypothetical protein